MHSPDIAPLAFLIGRWAGRGHGAYPTIDAFDYEEEIEVAGMPAPVLRYVQRTRDAATGAPRHAEAGWFRLPAGRPELVVAQPTGIVEVHTGTLEGQRVVLRSEVVATTPSAAVHRMAAVEREIEVADDVMRYRLSMAAVDQPLQTHLEAVLRRQA